MTQRSQTKPIEELSTYARRVRQMAPVGASWRRLSAELDRRRAPSPAILTSVLVGAACAMAAVAGVAIHRWPAPRTAAAVESGARGPSPAVTLTVPLDQSGLAQPLAKSPPQAQPRAAGLSDALPLPEGESSLSSTTLVALSRGSSAHTTLVGARPVVTLDFGELEIRSNERDEARRTEIWAGGYRFTDIGTVFAVSRQGEEVRLLVREGLVDVATETQPIARIVAGQKWQSAPRWQSGTTAASEARSARPPSLTPPSGSREPSLAPPSGSGSRAWHLPPEAGSRARPCSIRSRATRAIPSSAAPSASRASTRTPSSATSNWRTARVWRRRRPSTS